MVNVIEIINRYYDPATRQYQVLVEHSRQVADLAVKLAQRKPELAIDLDFLREAAMLHDIGIFRTHAPGIYCHGELPYLQHGVEGKKILMSLGLPRHALVCERHIGAGLTAQEIIDQKLPLEPRDMLPETLEEKLVTYADNFYSKSHIDKAKPLQKVLKSMAKYGEGTLQRMNDMVALFGSPDGLDQ